MPKNTTVINGIIQDNSALGDLPEWDLRDLYVAEDDPELKKDLDWLRKACSNFSEDYQGKLDKLGALGLLDAVERYQAIEVVAGKIMSFASLRYYQLTTDSQRTKFMSDMQDRVTKLTTPLVFYGLEFNRISGDRIASLLSENSDLARYQPVFDRMRAMKPYQLSDELEKFLHDQSVVGASAWNRLFDETIASLTFQIKGEELPLEAATNKLSDRNRDMREAAAREIARVLKKNTSLFARVHNTLAKDKEVEDQWRKMPTSQTGRHLSNHVEAEVVQALRDAVVTAYPKLSHRYYSLKAKWMGLEKMQIWDRNAPLPIEDERLIDWISAQNMVLSAYSEFAPKMAEIAEQFFTKGWIDAAVKPGKAPGAFAHPTVTTAHPYIMRNSLGQPRDVLP
jgi:oligoendopeptidase F